MSLFPARLTALATAALYKARRALGRPALPLGAVAKRTWTLYPGGRFPSITPVLLDGHIDRVICGATFGGVTPQADQLRAELTCADHEFFPLRIHELHDAVILDANVYAGRHKIDLYRQFPRHRWLLSGDAGEVDFAVLGTTYSGSRWFGHWLCDELPIHMLAHSRGPTIGHARPGFAHEAGYRAVFGIPDAPRYAACRVKRLHVIEETAYNPDKVARYRVMRERIGALPRGHERVFITRGSKWGERRRLLNQDQLRARLEREGFRAVNPEDHTVEDFLRICNGADEVIAAEGSHSMIAHFFMRDGGRFLSLHPANRVVPWSSLAAPFFNLVGGIYVCEPDPDSPLDYRADPDELLRARDLTNRRAAADAPALEAFQRSLRGAGNVIIEPRPFVVQPPATLGADAPPLPEVSIPAHRAHATPPQGQSL